MLICDFNHFQSPVDFPILSDFFRKGDCAFVGIYGEQDDFALVLLEDAEGDELSVTEELPQRSFEVQKAYAAKEHVRDAPKLGT